VATGTAVFSENFTLLTCRNWELEKEQLFI